MSNIDLSALEVDEHDDEMDRQTTGDVSQATTRRSEQEVEQEAPEPTAEELADQVLQRRRLIMLIGLYHLDFEKILGKAENLEEMSLEELKAHHTEIKLMVASRNTTKTAVSAFQQGLGVYEFLMCNFTPIDVSGITRLMANDENIIDMVKEIALENIDVVYTRPVIRLSYSLLQNSLILHSINSRQKAQALAKAPEPESTPVKNVPPQPVPAPPVARPLPTNIHQTLQGTDPEKLKKLQDIIAPP